MSKSNRFPRRLNWPPSEEQLQQMARAPSRFTPHPDELLSPDTFNPEFPVLSPTERELLDAVLASPDDDEPRLRYAAWCDIHDPARGEFIRLQLTRENPAREQEILHKEFERWSRMFRPWSARDLEFRRGFVEGLSLSGRAFLAFGEQLFRFAPIRSIRLVAIAPFMNELRNSSALSHLEALNLRRNQIGAAGVMELAGSDRLGRLHSLDLSGNGLGAEGIRSLGSVKVRLAQLSLADNGLTSEDIRLLMHSPITENLVDLDLSQNPLGSEIVGILAECGFLDRASRLRLESTELGPTGVIALSRAKRLPEFLDLGFNNLGDSGIAALAASTALDCIRTLILRGNRITRSGADAFLQAISSLKIHVDLSANLF